MQQGQPVKKEYIERFNRTFREEVLDAYLFENLEQAQDMANDWIRSYNEQRPHESFGGLPPRVFRKKNYNQKCYFRTVYINGEVTS
ncbi:MAG: transposase [Thermodesulfobacteriota bacterium]